MNHYQQVIRLAIALPLLACTPSGALTTEAPTTQLPGQLAAESTSAEPTIPAVEVTPPPYEVVSITILTTRGGRLDWSPDGEWIYYDRLRLDGFSDVYRIHPDGTGNESLVGVAMQSGVATEMIGVMLMLESRGK